MRRKKERGAALLAVVIIALVLGMTCFSLVVMATANSAASQDGLRRAVSLTVAEIGIERAKASITAGTFTQQFASQNHQAIENGAVFTPQGDLYGNYAVRVTEDYGGQEEQYLVVSQGTAGRTIRQVNVVVRRTPAVVPDLLAAITLYNPNALARFCGVPPNVCGLDTNLPASIPFSSVKASDCVRGSGDGPDAVGIGVHDSQSVADIIAALGKKTSRVTGTDGAGGSQSPSVYNVTAANPTGRTDPLTPADIVELADQFTQCTDYIYDGQNWYNGEGHPVGGASFGSTSDPRIVVVRGSGTGRLHLAGCLAGVGVLIVDSAVEFTGTFNYAGLILITRRGDAVVSVEMMGTPLVMGAMIAANPAGDAMSILDLRGTADVFYSRQALRYAEQALTRRAKFQTVFYMEKTPNAGDLEVN